MQAILGAGISNAGLVLTPCLEVVDNNIRVLCKLTHCENKLNVYSGSR